MIKSIMLTNQEIFNYSENLEKAFCEDTRYFPARINFYIQKNAHSLKSAYEEIEETRNNIILNYGQYDAETSYCTVPQEKIDIVNKEIASLMSLKQETSLYTLPLSWLDDLDLSFNQMDALMFMINDDISGQFEDEGVKEEIVYE